MLKQFLAEFGYIASAFEGVKRLREMVLSLAFQGDLSEHAAEDASGLLTFLRNSEPVFPKRCANLGSESQPPLIPCGRSLPFPNTGYGLP